MEQNISVVVASLIINDKGDILLFKSTKWQDWVTPGGHVELGETLKQAVIRETKEETNLDIETTDIFKFGETINPPTFYKKAHFIYFHFLAHIKSGKINLDPKELTDYKWFSPEEALEKCDAVIKPSIEKLAGLK